MRRHINIIASIATLIIVASPLVTSGGTISRVTKPSGTTDWAADGTVTATALNGDFNVIVNAINGNLDSDNISSIATTDITGCVGGTCSNPLGPQDIDDYSTNEAEANNDQPIGESGSLTGIPTDMEDELKVLRYAIRSLNTGVSVYRNNGSTVAVDWWELPVRGPNLVLNPSFIHDDDADGVADGWTIVDADADTTPSLVTLSQGEGYGTGQKIVCPDAGDGITQDITNLKAGTRYLIVVRMKTAAGDTVNLTTAGAAAASEWDDIGAASVTFSGITMDIKGVVVLTDATPTDITINLLATAINDQMTIASVSMYELSEDVIPAQSSSIGSQTQVSAKQDCAGGAAYVAVTNLAKTVTPPSPGYMIQVNATVSLVDGSAGANIETACELLQKIGAGADTVVAGPITGYVRQSTPESVSINFVNPAATSGSTHAYTVKCYCDAANALDFQGNIAGIGQTTSELSVVMAPNN